MVTRAEYLKQTYTELKETLLNDYGAKICSIFPSLDDISIADVIFYISFIFVGNNYLEVIKSYVANHSIDFNDDEILQLTNTITPYINQMKNLQ